MLDLSLSHLREDVRQALMGPGMDGVISYPKTPYGFFVYVPSEMTDFEVATLPGELKLCPDLARRQDCDWIMFDVDGTSNPELPQFGLPG